MRALTTVLMIIGAIAIIIFLFLLMGYFLFSLSPAIKSEMSISPVTYDAVQSFDNKVDAFKTEIKDAVAAENEKEVSLEITEEEINSKIVELLAEGELPCRDLLVNFEDDYCWTYAVMNNRGVDAKIGLITQFEVEDGKVDVVVEDFSLGKLPLPKSVDERVNSLLDIIWMSQGPFEDLPFEITYISIDKGSVTIDGVTTLVK
jgi:uncharacterized protein YpmS